MNDDRNAAADAFDGGPAAGRGCGRAEEFVTYLYGESGPEESKAFRLHLNECAVCRGELAALGGVREGLGVWRAEALGSIPSLDISGAFAPAAAAATRAPERKRSAAAAFREFFSLAPLWLRAGAFAAAAAFCALAALTFARAEVGWGADGPAFRAVAPERGVAAPPAPPAVAAKTEGLYTEEQLRAAVAREVAEATTKLRAPLEEEKAGRVVNAGAERGRTRPQAAGPDRGRRRAPRPGAGRDETLLADDNLPRLSDLLGGGYED